MDIFGRYFESTDGYQLLWPLLSIPILAVIPLVRRLYWVELRASGAMTGRVARAVEPKPQSLPPYT